MRKTPCIAVLCLAAALLAVAGCGPLPFQARVNAYLKPAAAGELGPASSFYLGKQPRAANPLLQQEVAAKLKHLLLMAHYQVGPGGRYRLDFDYGVERRSRNDWIWRQEPDRYLTVRDRRDGRDYYRTVRVPGRSYRESVVRTVFENRFTLRAWDGKELVWVGEVVADTGRKDLRVNMDYLLIAAVDSLGKNSGRVVEVSVSPEDPRLAQLKIFSGAR